MRLAEPSRLLIISLWSVVVSGIMPAPAAAGDLMSDNDAPASIQALCQKAQMQNATLTIGRLWKDLPTQTLACSKLFLQGGMLQAAANAKLTISPDFICAEYRQCFDLSNRGASLVFSETAPQVNPNWFGADWTGKRDSLPAFRAAYAAGDVLEIPAGTYSLSDQFVINRDGTSIRCPNDRSILAYAGTSHISSILLVAALPRGITRTIIQGCTLSGNGNIGTGDIEIVRGAGNTVRDITCNTNTPAPPASCVYFFNGNTNTAENITASGQSQSLPHPALTGIVFEDEVNSYILRPKLEEISNEGIKFFHGKGATCDGNTVIGGTSEGNGSGIVFLSCHDNAIIGLDLEAISVHDILDGGANNRFMSVSAIQPTFTAAARNSTFEGGELSGWTIEAGAVGVSIRESTFGNRPAPRTDNGECSSFTHNRSANGGNYWPDQAGCQNGLILQQSFNRVLEIPSAPITGAVCSANVITFKAPGHLLSPNFHVTVAGASPEGYNVRGAKVTVIGDSQFSVPVAACPGAWVSGGKINGSTDNALVGSFSAPSYFGPEPAACPARLDQSNDGMLFYVELAHNLRAGVNTFDFCGLGAMKIVKASDGTDSGPRLAGHGVTVTLRYAQRAGVFVDLSQ